MSGYPGPDPRENGHHNGGEYYPEDQNDAYYHDNNAGYADYGGYNQGDYAYNEEVYVFIPPQQSLP